MENNYTIKERILHFAKNQGISIEVFLNSIGMTYGSFKGNAKNRSLNSDAIVNIYTNYPKLNIEWLLLGKGEMLTKENTPIKQQVESIKECNLCKEKDKVILTQNDLIEQLKKNISYLEVKFKDSIENSPKKKAS